MKQILYKDLKFKKEWQYKNTESNIYFKNGIIRSVLFYSSLGGKIELSDAENVVEVLERIFKDSGFENGSYYRIADYSNVTKASFLARRLYSKTITRLNKKYNCKIKDYTYICGASLFIKVALTFAEKFIEQNFLFVPDINEAFEHINRETSVAKTTNNNAEFVTIPKNDIDKLVGLAGSVVWNKSDNNQDHYSISEDSPLYIFYHALQESTSDMRILLKQEEKLKNSIENNLKQQKLLADVSFEFTKLGKFEDKMNNAIRLIGEFTKVSRVYIFENFNDGEFAKNTYEWCNENIKPQIDDLHEVSYQIAPSFKKMLIEEGKLFSENIYNLPQDLINVFESQEIKSILVFPLYFKRQFFGFIGFDECDSNRAWDNGEVELLKTIANIILTVFEQKQTEEELHESEERHKLAISVTNDAIWDWDIKKNKVVYDDRYFTMAGYEPGAFSSDYEEWKKRVHPDDFSMVKTEMDKYISGNSPQFEVEFRLLKKDGTFMWILEKGKTLSKDEEGNPLRFMGIRSDISNRRKIEGELKESEELLRKIAENYPNSFISIIEKDFTVSFASGRSFKILNIEPESFIGLTLEQIFVEKATFVKEQYKKTFNGTEVSFELFIYNKYQHHRTIPFYAEDGSIQRIFAVVENITERKKIEQSLKESREQYFSLLANLNDIVYELHLNGEFVFINPTAEKIFETSLSEILSTPFYQFFDKRSQIKIYRAYKKYIDGKVAIEDDDELELKLNNGKILQVKASPITDENGKIIGTRGIGRDITEHVKIETALLESEEKFRVLFEKSDDAILIIDDGKFIDCNQSVVDMLGYSNKEELLHTHPSQLSPAKQPNGRFSHEGANEMIKIALEKGANHFEWVHLRADGTEFPAEISLTTIPYKGKKIIHVIWRDITEQKLKEYEIEQYQNNLEQLVYARTEEIIQYQEKLEDMVEERTLQFQQSEEKYRALLDNSNDTIMRFDNKFRHLYVSPSVKELTGLSQEMYIGKTREELGLPANLNKVWHTAIQGVFDLKKRDRIEVQIFNGKWIDWTLAPEFNVKGEVDSVHTSARDITERKKDEEQLRIKTEDLKMFNKAMVNREMRMIELKEEVNELSEKLKQNPPYPPIWKKEERIDNE